MRKAVLFALVLLVSAIWMQGQAVAQSSDKSSTPTTLKGCLTFDGHYRLTDDSGTVHQLSGEANRLTHYVNKRVELTGMPAVRTVDSNTQPGLESSVKEQNVFRVKTVKQTADTCSLAGK